VSFPEAVQTVLTQKYVDFSGRARRSEYWWFYLFSLIVSIVFNGIDRAIGTPIIGGLVSLAIFLPGLAVGIRRLHDTGRSGWWTLLVFFIIIGWIILLVWFVTDGTPGDNKYGPSPKSQGWDPNAAPPANPNWG